MFHACVGMLFGRMTRVRIADLFINRAESFSEARALKLNASLGRLAVFEESKNGPRSGPYPLSAPPILRHVVDANEDKRIRRDTSASLLSGQRSTDVLRRQVCRDALG
jgi:hypothetical protein